MRAMTLLRGVGLWLFTSLALAGVPIAECVQSGNNTSSGSWVLTAPNGSTNDLYFIPIAWDDSVTVTDLTEPAGPNGETLTEVNATPARAANAAGVSSRIKVWWVKATGTWSSVTLTFTPSASEQWSGSVCRVAAGQYDSSTPIGASQVLEGTSETDTAALSPEFSAGGSDGGGTQVWVPGINSDPLLSLDSGWTSVANQDIGAIAHGVATRDADVTNSESLPQASWTIESDAYSSVSFVLRDTTATGSLLLRRRRN
jgi:hypothetical protein